MGRGSRERRAESHPSLTVAARLVAEGGEAELFAAGMVGGGSEGVLLKEAGAQLRDYVSMLWRSGWEPVDVVEVGRRRLEALPQALVVDAMAEEATRRAPASLDHRWREQLAEAGAQIRWDADQTPLGARVESGVHAFAVLTAVIEAMAALLTLPPLPTLGSAAGTAVPGPRSEEAEGGDGRMLARVCSLLAKAESTEFPEEAEALSAKAQELMARHSIGRLAVEARTDERRAPIARRIWLDAPYVGAKAVLVSAVARANRCSAVSMEQLGFSTVIGDAADVAATELLVTSLLVQAARAVLEPGSTTRARSRAFRQSFLTAYAVRVGERLRQAADDVAADVLGDSLLPVLAASSERVEQAQRELFPRTTSRPTRISDGAGWAAGRAAADHAVIPTGSSLAGDGR